MSEKGALLIVDDTHESLKLLAELLAAAGYTVRPADSGALALASVAANPPALILLDLRMPGMDGFEVLWQLKAHPESQPIPVIILSAVTDMEQRVEGLKLGAVDFISKPFQREELLARVQTHLELSQFRARLEQMVTERTRELREAQEQLIRQEKLAVLGLLAGSIGHELRNPLGVISGAIYFLKIVQPDASEEVNEYLDIIHREVLTSDKIINDLLGFARAKSVVRAPVAVESMVATVLARHLPPQNITLHQELDPDLLPVWVDAGQIEQVLTNLIVNAYQAMPDGGQLSVTCEQLSVNNDLWVLINVKDTGTGIPLENMKQLFEPLFTTKAKGVGLGLAVSKRLVEANGGRIEVQSEAGYGSTFTIWLAANWPPQNRADP